MRKRKKGEGDGRENLWLVSESGYSDLWPTLLSLYD